ncbi:MAG: hypothetical protein R3C04_07955 [Hyphomonas sp.]
MKIRPVAGTIAAAVLLGACTTVPPEPAAAPEPGDLNGTWDVSMFYAADQPPSSTVMVLEAGGDGALAGSFYGSGFEEGAAAARRGAGLRRGDVGRLRALQPFRAAGGGRPYRRADPVARARLPDDLGG